MTNRIETILIESFSEHKALVEAFENHDSVKAESIMKQNWLRPMKEVYKFLVGKEKAPIQRRLVLSSLT